MVFDLEGSRFTGTITKYTPTTRFAYEEPWPIPQHPKSMTEEMTAWFTAIGVSSADVHRDLSLLDPIRTEFLLTNGSRDSLAIQIITSTRRSSTAWDRFFKDMVTSTAPIWDRLAAHLNEKAPS